MKPGCPRRRHAPRHHYGMLMGTSGVSCGEWSLARAEYEWAEGTRERHVVGALTRLSDLTTLRLGGPAHHLVECRTETSVIETVRRADAVGEPVLILGGGSNLVVSDAGFPGTVVRIIASGIEREDREDRTLLHVAAGEDWDRFVAHSVREGLAGVESLSGIPGLVGATPIQNVGAYGQEVAESIVRVRVYDRRNGVVRELSGDECLFSYRWSLFKREQDRWVVLAVSFALERQVDSRPIRYAELARGLGVNVGQTARLKQVRAAVLQLRSGKGMVLDAHDPDTVSTGSFFLNPVLTEPDFRQLEDRVRDRLGPDHRPPAFPQRDGRIKTSAAWLIERAGFHRGYGDPAGIAISSKHTLALTNRGHGTTEGLLALARTIRRGVLDAFGVELMPEPVFVGVSLGTP